MGTRHDIPTSWYAADTLLQGGRDKSRRTIANNTYLRPSRFGGDAIDLVLHNTAIVTYGRTEGLRIDTDGWYTVTTWDRVNRALPGPWRIMGHRIKGESSPWVWHGGYPVLPFLDGMTIDPGGESVSIGGEIIMNRIDIYIERERVAAIRETRAAARQFRLATQHAKGAAGAFGTAKSYDWQTRITTTVPAYHPRTYGGTVWDCADCVALRAVTA